MKTIPEQPGTAGALRVDASPSDSDYAPWKVPVHEHGSVDAALQGNLFRDGIHRMRMGEQTLDLLVQDSALLHGSPAALLVCFTSAVGHRTDRRPPFFSGRGVATALGLPLLAVSDPTLVRAGDLTLGWYAGNDGIVDLPVQIARLLEHFAARFGCRLVLFGGSGGGFAAMSVLQLLQTEAVGAVWNPQTSISDYLFKSASRYLKAAFPAIWRRAAFAAAGDARAKKTRLRECLTEAGVVHDLTRWRPKGNAGLLYLQNTDDWHVQSHAAPFMRGSAWPRIGPRTFRRTDQPLAIWFGCWGEGHVPPPGAVIRKILAELAAGTPVDKLAKQLDEPADKSTWFKRSALDDGLRPSVHLNEADGKLEVRCEFPSQAAHDKRFEFAFYLMADKRKLAMRWYSGSPVATFDLPADEGDLRVIAFVRDHMGSVVQAAAPVRPADAAQLAPPGGTPVVLGDTSGEPRATGSLAVTPAQIYLLKGEAEAILPDRLSFWPRGRRDVPPYPVAFPLDWDVDPYHDRNWCGQLHMWRLMDDHLMRYVASGDPQWLEMPLQAIDDWHRFHLQEARTSRYGWTDMIVGVRAMKLAYLLALDQAGRIQLGAERMDRFRALVSAHLGFLLDPANIRLSNHTFFDLQGAMALAQVVDAATGQQIREFVRGVLPRLLGAQFNPDGLHLEHSPDYHPFGINCLQRLHRCGWFGEFGVGDLLAKAVAMEKWLRLPDGRMTPIGDSTGAPMRARSVRANFRGRNQVLHNGGYVVIRDDGGGTTCATASYLFFMGAFHSRFHKQPDDLSFVWYEGEDILCDAGKYAYKSDINSEYVHSTRAHNTIEIDGKSYWDGTARHPYGTAVEKVSSEDWGHFISARVHQPRFQVEHRRFLLHAPGRWVLVIDHLGGRRSHDFTQWFHFAPHISLRSTDAGVHEGRLSTGRTLTVRSRSTAPGKTELVRGQHEPRMQGWISQKYRELQENDALGISASGQQAVFATLISLDDGGSALELLDEGKTVVASIRTGAAQEKLVLTIEEGSCQVRKA